MASVVAMKVLGTVMTASPVFDPGGDESESQGVGAASNTDTVFRAAKIGIVPLKAIDGSTTHKRAGP